MKILIEDELYNLENNNNNLYYLLSHTNYILDKLHKHKFNYIILQAETSFLLKKYILFLSKFKKFESIISILNTINKQISNISEQKFKSNKENIINYIEKILDSLDIWLMHIFIFDNLKDSDIEYLNNSIITNCIKFRKHIKKGK